MILPDFQLTQWANEQGGVEPFDPASINPASIDLKLSGEFIDLASRTQFAADEIVIKPGQAILASTLEFITMPKNCAGTVYLKSSMARKGLDHALAGWIDPGFHGEITLEFHAHRPITLCKGQKVCQLVLMQMASVPEKDYTKTDRYNGQQGPTAAR